MPTTPIDQVRLIDFTDAEPQTGMGFNSTTLVFPGTALTFTPGSPDPAETGQVVTGQAEIITSHEELMDRIGASVAVSGRYGLSSASVKASFSNSTGFNSTSTFVLAQASVRNPMVRGQNFRLTDTASQLLQAHDTDGFKTAFGDSFVRGIKSGGEFFAVFRLTSMREETQQNLAASLSAEINGIVAGVNFDTQFSNASQDENDRAEIDVSFYQAAGSGAEAAVTLDVNDILQRLKQFTTFAQNHPFPFKAEIATYNTIPIPIDTPVEDEDFVFSMSQDETKKLDYIRRKNDVDFAQLHPEYFVELPDPNTLRTESEVYVQLINAVMNHQVRLAKGQFPTPEVFDPSTVHLTEPPIHQFKRKPPAPSTAPDLHPFEGTWQNTNLQGTVRTLIIDQFDGVRTVRLRVHYNKRQFPQLQPPFPSDGEDFEYSAHWYPALNALEGGVTLQGVTDPQFGPVAIFATLNLQLLEDQQKLKVSDSEMARYEALSGLPPNQLPAGFFPGGIKVAGSLDTFQKTAVL